MSNAEGSYGDGAVILAADDPAIDGNAESDVTVSSSNGDDDGTYLHSRWR